MLVRWRVFPGRVYLGPPPDSRKSTGNRDRGPRTTLATDGTPAPSRPTLITFLLFRPSWRRFDLSMLSSTVGLIALPTRWKVRHPKPRFCPRGNRRCKRGKSRSEILRDTTVLRPIVSFRRFICKYKARPLSPGRGCRTTKRWPTAFVLTARSIILFVSTSLPRYLSFPSLPSFFFCLVSSFESGSKRAFPSVCDRHWLSCMQEFRDQKYPSDPCTLATAKPRFRGIFVAPLWHIFLRASKRFVRTPS